MEKCEQRCAVQGQDRGGVLAPGRLHPDLFVYAPAALQRAGAGVLRQRRRLDSVRVGQRHVRDERVGQGPGIQQHRPDPGRQRRVHRGHGHAGGQGRPGLRQALVALLHAGEGRRGAEDVRRAAEAGRPLRSVGRRHHAGLCQSQGQEARPGGDLHARRLPVLREGQGAADRASVTTTQRSLSHTTCAAG